MDRGEQMPPESGWTARIGGPSCQFGDPDVAVMYVVWRLNFLFYFKVQMMEGYGDTGVCIIALSACLPAASCQLPAVVTRAAATSWLVANAVA